MALMSVSVIWIIAAFLSVYMKRRSTIQTKLIMGLGLAAAFLALIAINSYTMNGKIRAQAALKMEQNRNALLTRLADHRRQQLDELHTLLTAHNKRAAQDAAMLEYYQQKQQELEDYINEDMADRDNLCLDLTDVGRLHHLWSNPHSAIP